MILLGIIEDNNSILNSLIEYFRNDPDINVSNVGNHVDEFNERNVVAPHVILLDLQLPFRNGIECIGELVERYPDVSIIIHSVSADYDSIFQCLCNGAQSYLTKGESLSKIKETIIETNPGGSQMSVQIARKVIDYFKASHAPAVSNKLESLTEKESQLVQLILEGCSYKMCAEKLELSINTVRYHIKAIYRKLNINSSMELASLYMKK
jgi:DNA-binding NarL/FixJ family response regulator